MTGWTDLRPIRIELASFHLIAGAGRRRVEEDGEDRWVVREVVSRFAGAIAIFRTIVN